MKICESEGYFASLENPTQVGFRIFFGRYLSSFKDEDAMVTDETENKRLCYVLLSKFIKVSLRYLFLC